MLSDRKTAFWIVLTLIACTFVIFILLTAVFPPDTGVSGVVNDELRAELEALRQAVWWTTMAMVMLPILMMLITLAMYLFITGNPAPAAKKAPAVKKDGPFDFISKPKPKKVEVTSTADVLDLRYARGEITREQYLAMKADLLAQQAAKAQQPQA